MDPVQAAILINQLLATAMNVWTSCRQVNGEDSIPPWEDILKVNTSLQAKIDQEKLI